MITVKKTKPDGPPPKTLEEVFAEIEAAHKLLSGVSDQRHHAVESHLRGCIRLMGFRPRETAAKPASIGDLIEQCQQALLALEGNVPEERLELLALFLTSILSNLEAEAKGWGAPPSTPVPVPEPPKAGGDAGKPPLLPGAAKVAVLAVLGFLAMLLAPLPAPAQFSDSFNITNTLTAGINVVSYPTNGPSTNFVVTGYTTNFVGTTTNIQSIQTNGYYPNQQTGKQVEVRNYTFAGFVFTGVATTTNGSAAVETIQLIRSGAASAPVVISNSAAPNIRYWEGPSNLLTLSVPLPVGTNVPFYWMTNLDEWYLKPAAFVGIYGLTNNSGFITNAQAGLLKKTIPVSLSGGNF